MDQFGGGAGSDDFPRTNGDGVLQDVTKFSDFAYAAGHRAGVFPVSAGTPPI
jgi:hypothetical protein